MPKLLSVNNYHYRRGGAETLYLEHAALLERMGWENAFFSMNHPKNLPTPWSRHFIDELEFGHDYSAWQKLLMATKVVYSFEAQTKLKRLLAEYPADVAHLHCIYHHLSPAILPTLASAGIPVVLTAHDLKLACPAYTMARDGKICEACRDGSLLNVVRNRCVKNSLLASSVIAVETGLHRALRTYQRHVSVLVAPSRFFCAKLVEWGWPADKLTYVPNFIDAADIVPQYQPGGYLLYVGRLAKEKGLATLLEAAIHAGIPLKLAGTGPFEAELKARCARADGADIQFLGYVTGQAMADAVRGAWAVVLPSELYENAPMSVLEAMAFGKPVIGARIGGIPELIDEGETGWTFTAGSVDELASVMSSALAAGSAKLSRMGQAARARVLRDFSRERYASSMLRIYDELGVQGIPAEYGQVAHTSA